MASRSKKKRNSIDNKPSFSKEYYQCKQEKETKESQLTLIMIVSLLLIVATLFFPLTGLSVTVTPDDFAGSTPQTPPENNTPSLNNEEDVQKFSSSVSSITIIFSPIKDLDWIAVLSRNLLKDADDDIKDNIAAMVNSNIKTSQREKIDNVMWFEFAVSLAIFVLWVALLIATIICLVKHKSTLAMAILACLLALLSFVEFIVMFAVGANAQKKAMITVNFGAYILPMVTILVATLITTFYFKIKSLNKKILDEEMTHEKMSSM